MKFVDESVHSGFENYVYRQMVNRGENDALYVKFVVTKLNMVLLHLLTLKTEFLMTGVNPKALPYSWVRVTS